MTRAETRDVLAGMSGGEPEAIAKAVGVRDGRLDSSTLPDTTVALVRIAALIAMDAPPASYGRQVGAAFESGASAEDILNVLRAVAPQVGSARVIAAAPELMLAMGMSLPGCTEEDV